MKKVYGTQNWGGGGGGMQGKNLFSPYFMCNAYIKDWLNVLFDIGIHVEEFSD